MRIPANPFGREVAPAIRQPGPSPLPAQYNNPVGPALERLGRTGSSVGIAMMDDALREKAEAERQAELQRREDERKREAAEKAQALDQLSQARQSLDQLGLEFEEGLQSGSIDKTQAEAQFKERVAKLRTDRLSAVPAAHADAVARDMDEAASRMGISLRRAITKRDEVDTRAGLLSHLEAVEREAAKNPAALQAGLAAIQELGPFAGLNAEQQQKLSQSLRERVTLNRALDAFNGSKQSTGALNAFEKRLGSDEFSDLDPARKTALLDQVDTRRVMLAQRAEVAAQRAAREAEQKIRTAAAAADAFGKFLDSGGIPDEAYLATVNAQTAGTPFAAVVPQMAKQAASTGGFAAQPVAVMDASIAVARNKAAGGSNPAQQEDIDRLVKLRESAVREYREDALPAAHKRGVIRELTPLRFTDIASLPQQLAQRREQAAVVAGVAGHPVSPLTQGEAETLGKMLVGLPPDQKSQWLASIGAAVGDKDQVTALARQIDKQDKLLATAMMYANTRTSESRNVSEIILRGQQAAADGRVKVDTMRETGWRADIARRIGTAYADQELRSRMIDATVAVATGLASEGPLDMSQAVRLATGGIVTQADDSMIPLPYGWSEKDFSKRLRSFTAADIGTDTVVVAGMRMPVDRFLSQLPNAVLQHSGQGKYVVRSGDFYVTDVSGRRIELDFNN